MIYELPNLRKLKTEAELMSKKKGKWEGGEICRLFKVLFEVLSGNHLHRLLNTQFLQRNQLTN